MEIDNLLENISIVSNDTINTIELKEFPKEGCCKTNRIELRDYLKNKFSQYLQKSWRSYYNIVAWNEIGYWFCEEKSSKPEYQLSQLQKFFAKEEVKQPLKQSVHCKTQEEWDFVLSKLPSTCLLSEQSKWFEEYIEENPNGIAINTSECLWDAISLWKKEGYQILSFQEWCNLNGYKMGKKVEFEVGKWYSIKTAYNWIIKFKEIKHGNIRADWHCLNERGKKVEEGGYWESKPTEIKELSIEEIQLYLPEGHPNKIKTNIKFEVGDWVVNLENSISYSVNEICKVSKISKTHLACENKPQGEDSMKPFDKFRHATPEEIQQYLPEEHPYKFKSNQEFKVGDYVILENAHGWNYSSCNNGCLGLITKMSNYKPSTVDKYICSITGDILNSKNKDTKFNNVPVAFYEGKWIVRHATLEEINNHLISIGQIPAGEPLNTGIEPDKDGMFKYTTNVGSTFVGNCSTLTDKIPVKPKLILSIDDEELPMVNIIKTNSIKQLLNLE